MSVNITIPTVQGSPVRPGNEFPVRIKGSNGVSYSQNLPDVATLGVLLLTIPANLNRAHAFIENQSENVLTLVGDVGDGTQVWHRKLTGTGLNSQGADWTGDTFFGRLRVYGIAGSQVAAAEF